MEDKYKVLAPEMMNEAAMSDSEEEGGRLHSCFQSSSVLDGSRIFNVQGETSWKYFMKFGLISE